MYFVERGRDFVDRGQNVEDWKDPLELCQEFLYLIFLGKYGHSNAAAFASQLQRYPNDLIYQCCKGPVSQTNIYHLYLLANYGVIAPSTAVVYLYYLIKESNSFLSEVEFQKQFFSRAMSPSIWNGSRLELLDLMAKFPTDTNHILFKCDLASSRIRGKETVHVSTAICIEGNIPTTKVLHIIQSPEIKGLPRKNVVQLRSQEHLKELLDTFVRTVEAHYKRLNDSISYHYSYIHELYTSQVMSQNAVHLPYLGSQITMENLLLISAIHHLAVNAGTSREWLFEQPFHLFMGSLVQLAEKLRSGTNNSDVNNFIKRLMRCLAEDTLNNHHGNDFKLCDVISREVTNRAKKICCVWTFCFAILDPTWDQEKYNFVNKLVSPEDQATIIAYLRHGRIHSPGAMSWLLSWKSNFSSYIIACCDEFNVYRDYHDAALTEGKIPQRMDVYLSETFHYGRLLRHMKQPLMLSPLVSTGAAPVALRPQESGGAHAAPQASGSRAPFYSRMAPEGSSEAVDAVRLLSGASTKDGANEGLYIFEMTSRQGDVLGEGPVEDEVMM